MKNQESQTSRPKVSVTVLQSENNIGLNVENATHINFDPSLVEGTEIQQTPAGSRALSRSFSTPGNQTNVPEVGLNMHDLREQTDGKSLRICQFYKTNKCHHGMRGHKYSFQNPKSCAKFTRHGLARQTGCRLGSRRKDFHPSTCKYSLHKREINIWARNANTVLAS